MAGCPWWRRRVLAVTRPPVAVWAACVLVWLQSAACVAAATAFVVVLARGAQMPAATGVLVVLALGTAALLALAGRALLAGRRRWARSPVLTAQVLVGALAVAGWSTTPLPWPPLVLALVIAVAAALLTPGAVAWTMPSRESGAQ